MLFSLVTWQDSSRLLNIQWCFGLQKARKFELYKQDMGFLEVILVISNKMMTVQMYHELCSSWFPTMLSDN